MSDHEQQGPPFQLMRMSDGAVEYEIVCGCGRTFHADRREDVEWKHQQHRRVEDARAALAEGSGR